MASWVIPDRLYGLYSKEGGQGRRRYFCLEFDRATMPIVRSNPYQSSYLRKMLAYSYTHARDVLYKEFGIERFQVLSLTTSAKRIRTMQNAYREHIPRDLRRPNLFLFAELAEVHLDTDVFALTWQNANGKPAKLPL